jgi:hypothetical protein
MESAIASAIVIGLAGGAFAGYLGARAISRVLGRKSSHPRVVAGFVAAGYIAAMSATFFLSFVVGGNIGGGSGAFVSESLNLGSVGVPLGLANGIAAVLAAGLVIGAVLGGVIGHGVSIALKGSSR